jgi:uncharacterized glyoxalase superfamily protein PhnB
LRVEGVEALHEELKARGAKILQEPITRFYKMREIEVQDTNGYVIVFAEDVA